MEDKSHLGEPNKELCDDSRLFKLEFLFKFNTKKCTFCENGQKKVLASVSDDSFYFYLMDIDDKRSSKEIPWDMKRYPVIDMCFDPSGTWLLVLSQSTLQIIPVLPFLEPEIKHDLKWPTNKITKIELNPNHARNPTAIVWWQTRESQQIAIIGDKAGDLIFFSLENLEIIGKSCIVGEVNKLTVYIDHSFDTTTLLINSNKNRQWQLSLEQMTSQYNWISGKKALPKSKESNTKLDSFLASFKEMGSDKMSSLFQMKSQSVTDVMSKLSTSVNRSNPTPITFDSYQENNISKKKKEQVDDAASSGVPTTIQWIVSPQQADGRHFVSLFNKKLNILILQLNIDVHKPVFVYSLGNLPADIQSIIWQQRIIYTFGKSSMQIHSSYLASQEEHKVFYLLYDDKLDEGEEIVGAFGVREFSNHPHYTQRWNYTTDIKKLDLPRFDLNSCLVVSDKKTYLLTTRCDPCEWLVDKLINAHEGVEKTAAALKISIQPLLLAAADLLLARDCFTQALSFYKLTNIDSDAILMRCAALGLYSEMLSTGISPQSTPTADIFFVSHALQTIKDKSNTPALLKFIVGNTYYTISECLTLAVDLGLWEAVKVMSFDRGMIWACFQALVYRFTTPCRGLWSAVISKHYVPFIITDSALPLLKYIEQYCETFDSPLLKELCIWMCPLQECFYIIFKDLSTSQPNTHLSGMRRLIRTFFCVLSTLHSRIACVAANNLFTTKDILSKQVSSLSSSDSFPSSLSSFTYPQPTVVSCGHGHWAITYQGKIYHTYMDGSPGFMNIDLELVGKPISVACGRKHTILLTKNGVYGIGSNKFGQLGVGSEIKSTIDTPILVGCVRKDISTEGTLNKGPFSWNNEQVVQIEAGQYHSACVTDTGDLYTWGWGVHGQLGHGTIHDEYVPKKVTTLKSEKVKYVGCGACHTAMLSHSGHVLLCGNGAFGQMGNADRSKFNIPTRIDLGPNIITRITVGYFHTLALTEDNEIWVWGSSPQSLRIGAISARRIKAMAQDVNKKQNGDSNEQSPPSPSNPSESHLTPTKLNTANVNGKIIEMAAGWHHSCLVSDSGSLYIWGYNFDGQLGTGDQRQLSVPTLVEFSKTLGDLLPSAEVNYDVASQRNKNSFNSSMSENKYCCGKLGIGCGGDYTVFFNADNELFIAGNSYKQFQDANSKGEPRIVKSKITKRIIRLPDSPLPAQRTFRRLPLPAHFIDQSYQHLPESSFERPPNTITRFEDFHDPLWAVNTLYHLRQFVDDDTPLLDIHLRAQLASMRGDFVEALNLQLNALHIKNQDSEVQLFLKHSTESHNPSDNFNMACAKANFFSENPNNPSHVYDILLQDIKNQSRSFYETGDIKNKLAKNFTSKIENLNCQCSENKYLIYDNPSHKSEDVSVEDITSRAKDVFKSVLNILPGNVSMWEECVDQATTFWIDNNLDINELENIFSLAIADGHAINMASALFCRKNKVDYQKHLSTAFNLELCDNILQSW